MRRRVRGEVLNRRTNFQVHTIVGRQTLSDGHYLTIVVFLLLTRALLRPRIGSRSVPRKAQQAHSARMLTRHRKVFNMVVELWFDSADTVATAGEPAALLAGEIAEKDDPDDLMYEYNDHETIAKGVDRRHQR